MELVNPGPSFIRSSDSRLILEVREGSDLYLTILDWLQLTGQGLFLIQESTSEVAYES